MSNKIDWEEAFHSQSRLLAKAIEEKFALRAERDEMREALAAIEKRLAEKCTATCMTTEDYTVIMEARRVLGSKERA